MSRSHRAWNLALPLLLLTLGSCATGRLAPPAGEPVADPAAFAEQLRSESLPGSPQQVNFSWTLDESGSRVRGRGVVRAEAAERIRLDLFGPRGETYLMAALVGEEYRLPGAAPAALSLPSPSLLWAAMGVLQPPRGAALAEAAATGAGAELRYTVGNEVFAYTFTAAGEAGLRLSRLERAGPRGVLETVSIERAPTGQLARVQYRDWSEFRDLTLDVEEVRATDGFPAAVWRPDAPVR